MEPVAGALRPTGVNRSSSLLVAALLGLAVVPLPSSGAAASCAAPWLDVGGATLRAGRAATVTGTGFVDGCQDSMGCSVSFGCSSCSYDDPPPEPYEQLTLRLVQGGRTWTLGTADADENGDVAWRFAVPEVLERGSARLVTEVSDPERVRIR